MEEYVRRSELLNSLPEEIKQQHIKQIERFKAKRKITRLENIIAEMNRAIDDNYAYIDKMAGSNFENSLTEAYYRTGYNIEKYVGVRTGFQSITRDHINTAMSAMTFGKNYSERIWGSKVHRNELARKIERLVAKNMIEGQSYDNLIKELGKSIQASKSQITNLVVTECAAFSEAGSLNAYEQLHVDEYEIIATLDLKTSSICQSMDGKTFKTSEAVIGENCPPFHGHCRTTTAPALDKEAADFFAQYDKARAARDENGKTVLVKDMDYQMWRDTCVA